MARPMPTTVTCPNCGQPFNALLEQILDVGTDPSVKDRLLSNQINTVTCPHCGWNGQIGTPLVYHDPAKPLAIVHVPMQLNIDQTERERMVGQLTQTLMRTLPEDAPKGHLLQPQTALTMQGLIE
ncbi:MAG: CpXC domain-containing protein [Anaerolineae bacterium]